MNRDEHVAWCKQRALKYLDSGDTVNALTSMMSDLEQHPETKNHAGSKIGLQLMMMDSLSSVPDVRRFIEGFH